MSAITTSPAWSSPGGSTSDSFGAASVTVIAADRHWPSRCGVSAERPLGRSTDTIGMPITLTSATTVSSRPASGALSPVPTIASTMSEQRCTSEACSSQRCSSSTSITPMPRRPRMSRLMRASPFTCATGASRNTDTSTPRCASVRATTKPSPPLLPLPHRMATRPERRSSYADSIADTTCRPAFSISTSEAMPTSSIVWRSASRIWRGVQNPHRGQAYSSTAGQLQTRLRSPNGLSTRPTAGQNLWARTNGSGNAAASRE